MVIPERCASLALSRSSRLRNWPDIGVCGTRCNRIVCLVFSAGIVLIGSAFGILAVEHTVWVNAVRARRIVLENNPDCVSNLGANERAQDAKMRPTFGTRLQGVKAGVGVLAEDDFAVYRRVRVQHSFGSRIILEMVFLAVDLVHAGRSIVPVDFVRCQVVGASPVGRPRLAL